MSETKKCSRGITIAGNIIVDILNNISEYPKPSMLAPIHSSSKAVGGCVPNTIIDIAKIDPTLKLNAYGLIGDDDNGKLALSYMESAGVNVDNVKTAKGMGTGTTYVMFDMSTKERTFFCALGANAVYDVDDVDVDSLDCDIFHAGYAFLMDRLDEADAEDGTRFAKLLRKASERGIKTSLDAVSADRPDYAEKLIPALKHCSYTIMNESECCAVSGLAPYHEDGSLHIENIKKTLEMFMDYGVKEKAIIHCRDAGFMMTADREFIMVPSFEIPKDYIKGSVGAGDAFAAGCLYGLYQGYDNKRILEFASCASAANLSEADAVSGLRTKEELEKIEKMFKRKTL
ncbi:MAG: carbohydrate kinase family protein [Clostridia bacterium]|nr:carbohydrate kinase family protein [Clostridia bacterium]